MKYCLKILFATIFISFSLQGFSAVNVVECEDERGGKSFQKACPPGSTQVGSKKISTGSSGSDNDNSNIKATLYFIPNCDTCDEVREFLNANGVSFDEKNANETVEIQEELTKISGGLKIPTTVIGAEVIVGYRRSEFEAALGKAKDAEPEPAAVEPDADKEPTE